MNKLQKLYEFLLAIALRFRILVLAAAGALFFASLLLLSSLGMELLPRMDTAASFVTIETPSGSTLDETEQVIKNVEQIIRKETSLDRISAQIGFEPGMRTFGSGVQGPTQGYITITWIPRTERDETIWDIQNRLREKIAKVPGIENSVIRESGSTAVATTASSIVVSLKGPDPLILDRLGERVLDIVDSVPGTVNTYRAWRRDQRSVTLSVDAERARELGISPVNMSQELVQALDSVNAGIYRGSGDQNTLIRVRYAQEYRSSREDAYAVRIFADRAGMTIPAGAVVTGKEITSQGLVTRENLQPTLDILALHQNRPLSFVSRDVGKAVKEITVPEGYTVAMAGEEADMAESRSELAGALGIALIAVYLLLVAQFKSFKHPVTVLAAVPLSLIGVSLALLIAGKPVSMPVLVGLILLIGIVVNNSIILIDFIQQRRESGVEKDTAVKESVAARFRPIMMTSLSTIAGMIPLAMEWALGAERFSPLAVAVIGGMTAATFLTMIVIPVFYSVMEDIGTRSGRSG